MNGTTPGCDLAAVAARMRPFVARRVAPGDVDDVLQEILLRVHVGFETMNDDDHFARWIQRIATQVVVDHHRRLARRERKHRALADESSDTSEVDEDAQGEFATFVSAFVEMLPSPYREAITRTEMEGMTMAEAARREGVSETAMKSRVRRGRRLLRELFEACCEIALDVRGNVVDYTPKG